MDSLRTCVVAVVPRGLNHAPFQRGRVVFSDRLHGHSEVLVFTDAEGVVARLPRILKISSEPAGSLSITPAGLGFRPGCKTWKDPLPSCPTELSRL